MYRKLRAERKERLESYKNNKRLKDFAVEYGRVLERNGWGFNLDWFGVPCLQNPIDLHAKQELIWKVRPDLIIEIGLAYGGSLIWSSGILTLMEICGRIKNGQVLGVDLGHREHFPFTKHPLFNKITLIQGSSSKAETIQKVKRFARGKKRIMVFLDSAHSHKHVLAELRAYSSLVNVGSYIVVEDTFVEDLDYSDMGYPTKQWGKGNNPRTAVWEFLKENKNFVIDEEFENKIQFTLNGEGYLKRIK